jgi:hypothetical protein
VDEAAESIMAQARVEEAHRQDRMCLGLVGLGSFRCSNNAFTSIFASEEKFDGRVAL